MEISEPFAGDLSHLTNFIDCFIVHIVLAIRQENHNGDSTVNISRCTGFRIERRFVLYLPFNVKSRAPTPYCIQGTGAALVPNSRAAVSSSSG